MVPLKTSIAILLIFLVHDKHLTFTIIIINHNQRAWKRGRRWEVLILQQHRVKNRPPPYRRPTASRLGLPGLAFSPFRWPAGRNSSCRLQPYLFPVIPPSPTPSRGQQAKLIVIVQTPAEYQAGCTTENQTVRTTEHQTMCTAEYI